MAIRIPTTFTVAKPRVFLAGAEQAVGTVLTSTQVKGLLKLSALVSMGYLWPNRSANKADPLLGGTGDRTARARRPDAFGAAARRSL